MSRIKRSLKQLRLFSLTHWRIRDGLISMFKITHCLSDSPWTPSSPIQLIQGYAAMSKFLQHRRRQYAFSVHAVPCGNKMKAEVVNASSVKSLNILRIVNWMCLFPEVLILFTSSHCPFPLHTRPLLETHSHMAIFTCHSVWSSMAVLSPLSPIKLLRLSELLSYFQLYFLQ